MPGFHCYNDYLQYQTYDVTSYLKRGDNLLSVYLGNGWYRGRLGYEGGFEKIFGDDLALIFEMYIEYVDGSEIVFFSGEKADDRFAAGYTDMPPQIAAAAKGCEGGGHAAGAAGEEAIGQAHPAAQLPQGQQTQQQSYLPQMHLPILPPVSQQIGLPGRGRGGAIHGDPAPSIWLENRCERPQCPGAPGATDFAGPSGRGCFSPRRAGR